MHIIGCCSRLCASLDLRGDYGRIRLAIEELTNALLPFGGYGVYLLCGSWSLFSDEEAEQCTC